MIHPYLFIDDFVMASVPEVSEADKVSFFLSSLSLSLIKSLI